MSTDNLTFVHGFSRRVEVTITVKDEPPNSGQISDLRFAWMGRPKQSLISEYRQFMLGAVHTLADKWGRSILYAIGTNHDRRDFWKVLVTTTNIGFL